jgi:hypothetical protein
VEQGMKMEKKKLSGGNNCVPALCWSDDDTEVDKETWEVDSSDFNIGGIKSGILRDWSCFSGDFFSGNEKSEDVNDLELHKWSTGFIGTKSRVYTQLCSYDCSLSSNNIALSSSRAERTTSIKEKTIIVPTGEWQARVFENSQYFHFSWISLEQVFLLFVFVLYLKAVQKSNPLCLCRSLEVFGLNWYMLCSFSFCLVEIKECQLISSFDVVLSNLFGLRLECGLVCSSSNIVKIMSTVKLKLQALSMWSGNSRSYFLTMWECSKINEPRVWQILSWFTKCFQNQSSSWW